MSIEDVEEFFKHSSISAIRMNAWVLNNESVVPHLWTNKTINANEIEGPSVSSWESGTKLLRTKRRGKVEFLVVDHQLSDDDVSDKLRAGGDAVPAKVTHVEANSVSIAEPVNEDNRPANSTPSHGVKENRKRQKSKSPTELKERIFVHHLVRDFLLMHSHNDIVQLLDQERSMPILTATEMKHLSRRLLGTDQSSTSPSGSPSLLERFLVRSNDVQLKARSKRKAKKQSTFAEKDKLMTTASASRCKPSLNVITRDLDPYAENCAVISSVSEQPFNRLHHPGSTSHHEIVIGQPGSTPMARSKDLHLSGFKDVESDVVATAVGENVDKSVDLFSHYAHRKRSSNTGHKRVQLGESGKTPTKEYIFFRETPPSFVTETIEDAVKIVEKLNSNTEFVNQATDTDRFIELQSSEVSKYTIGQAIQKLGPHYNINGVVVKIFGSRLCGTAGRGSIIVDTCPENLHEQTCVEAQ